MNQNNNTEPLTDEQVKSVPKEFFISLDAISAYDIARALRQKYTPHIIVGPKGQKEYRNTQTAQSRGACKEQG